MKTIDLYLKVLNEIRFDILGNNGCNLSDFEQNDKAYELLNRVNTASNLLSDLICIMSYEK